MFGIARGETIEAVCAVEIAVEAGAGSREALGRVLKHGNTLYAMLTALSRAGEVAKALEARPTPAAPSAPAPPLPPAATTVVALGVGSRGSAATHARSASRTARALRGNLGSARWMPCSRRPTSTNAVRVQRCK